jgi:hypothetical protein
MTPDFALGWVIGVMTTPIVVGAILLIRGIYLGYIDEKSREKGDPGEVR